MPAEQSLLQRLWDAGADRYITNLRRLKLFANKIAYSYDLIGTEVNFDDFVAIELIRDISPALYEAIRLNGEYFYDPGLAFETWGQRLHYDDKEDRKQRKEFYDRLKKLVPSESQYVFDLLALIFPSFAQIERESTRNRPTLGEQRDPEKEKRISHPRFFRQYFLFRVPPELFGQRQFEAFIAALRGADEEQAFSLFTENFVRLIDEEFKRWHFMHKIDLAFDEIGAVPARGLCRGMAAESSQWSRDAFEFDIAVRCTYKTLLKLKGSTERQDFLRNVIEASTSSLYTVYLPWIIEKNKEVDRTLLPEIEAVKPFVQQWMAKRYLVPDPPSVYDEFQSIDPNQVLFGWRRLGPTAEADQKKYLRNLLSTKPESLDKFLKLLFRPMMDDYSALREVFDYDEIADFIRANESKLDPEKVQEFWERYNRDKESAQPGTELDPEN
jgi:hypothetical protein